MQNLSLVGYILNTRGKLHCILVLASVSRAEYMKMKGKDTGMFEFIKKLFRREKKEEPAEVTSFKPEVKEVPEKAEQTIPESRYTEDYKQFVENMTAAVEEQAEEVRKTAAAAEETAPEVSDEEVTAEEMTADPFADLAAMEDDEEKV